MHVKKVVADHIIQILTWQNIIFKLFFCCQGLSTVFGVCNNIMVSSTNLWYIQQGIEGYVGLKENQ